MVCPSGSLPLPNSFSFELQTVYCRDSSWHLQAPPEMRLSAEQNLSGLLVSQAEMGSWNLLMNPRGSLLSFSRPQINSVIRGFQENTNVLAVYAHQPSSIALDLGFLSPGQNGASDPQRLEAIRHYFNECAAPLNSEQCQAILNVMRSSQGEHLLDSDHIWNNIQREMLEIVSHAGAKLIVYTPFVPILGFFSYYGARLVGRGFHDGSLDSVAGRSLWASFKDALRVFRNRRPPDDPPPPSAGNGPSTSETHPAPSPSEDSGFSSASRFAFAAGAATFVTGVIEYGPAIASGLRTFFSVLGGLALLLPS